MGPVATILGPSAMAQGDPGDPMDVDGHGTRVGSIAGARTDNCRSIAGVGWQSAIIPIKLFESTYTDQQSGCDYAFRLTASNVARAFEYAASRGARIVNCSWGFDSHSSAVESTFKALSKANMVAVVAAGNYLVNIDDPAAPAVPGLYPARYTFSNMIVVGATSITDKAWQHPGIPSGTLGSGSNFGANSVDLFAPGDGVRAMLDTDSTVSCTAVTAYGEAGTSFAAPLVSGVAAMVWTLTPSLTAEDVVQVLKGTVRYNLDLNGQCATSGIVNAAGAVGLGPCTP